MSLQKLRRRFRFGPTVLEDADPSLEPIESLRLYQGTYPFLAVATLGEPEVEQEFLTFPVQKPAAATKG